MDQFEQELENYNNNVIHKINGVSQDNANLREKSCEIRNLKSQITTFESCIQDKSNEIKVLNAQLSTARSDLEREKSFNNFLLQGKPQGHANCSTPSELKSPDNEKLYKVIDSWERDENITVDINKSQHLDDIDGCKTYFFYMAKRHVDIEKVRKNIHLTLERLTEVFASMIFQERFLQTRRKM